MERDDKDRIEGSAQRIKGKVKEAVGKATGDSKLDPKARCRKVQNAVGNKRYATPKIKLSQRRTVFFVAKNYPSRVRGTKSDFPATGGQDGSSFFPNALYSVTRRSAADPRIFCSRIDGRRGKSTWRRGETRSAL